MKDMVPLGTGNSRTLKSGIDSNMTWEQFRAALISGSLPIDLGAINPAGVAQVGDPLNKANLLPDDVVTALGLTGNPQVKDALEKLSRAALRKVVYLKPVLKISDMVVGSTYNLFGRVFLCVASDYPVANTKMLITQKLFGTYTWGGLQDGNNWLLNSFPAAFRDICVPVTIGTQVIGKKVFNLSGQELGGFGGEGSPIPYFNSDSRRAADGAYWTRTIPSEQHRQVITASGAPKSDVPPSSASGIRSAIVLSNDSELYLGADGKYDAEQIYKNSLTDMFGNDFSVGVKIEVGSYTGTGTFGEGNPNSLTLGFNPKFVMIRSRTLVGSYVYQGYFFNEYNSTFYQNNGSSDYVHSLTASFSASGLSWYTSNSNFQLNTSSVVFDYVAIG